ncbi:MAG: NAD(P)/FAD-dependent oxidoreductase [Deltaproteobacteria bacterium]|nr:NAD(P)/FAD-dependent oxidoreductase [Deltaproteobacteria bacterium]
MKFNQTRQQFTSDYDCIVIGAGNGGLASALQLAKKGVRVLLVEQHNLPGGFASSFVRGRFEFEIALHEIADVGPYSTKQSLREMLEDDFGLNIEWVEVPEAYHLIIDEKKNPLDIKVPFGLTNFINTVEQIAPGSREAVTRYIAVCKEAIDGLLYLKQSRGKPNKLHLIKNYPSFIKTSAYTVEEVLDAMHISHEARSVLNGYWCYLGLPPNRLGFTLFGAMLNRYISTYGFIPRLRSHELTLKLAERFKECGGQIAFNTRVDKILVKDEQVYGIETHCQEVINSKYIICNLSPTVVFNKLIHPKTQVPKQALRECNARLHGSSAFVVYMGLDALPKEIGLDSYSYFIMDNHDINDIYNSFGRLEAPLGQATVCLNNAIPDCSPPGTSIVSITTLFQPHVWQGVRQEDYFKLKSEIAAGLIEKLEKATGASIRKYIEEIEIATPQTMARYTSSYEGIVYGYEPEPWDSIIARMKGMQAERHFAGLSFCGGFGFRSHGYLNALSTGQTAALMTYKEILEGRN